MTPLATLLALVTRRRSIVRLQGRQGEPDVHRNRLASALAQSKRWSLSGALRAGQGDDAPSPFPKGWGAKSKTA